MSTQLRSNIKIITWICLAIFFGGTINGQVLPQLKISANKRFFVTANNKPFFWLGDTGWLLFSKLTREEANDYLNDRKQKGFNVIQAMLLHELTVINRYGDSAISGKNVAAPLLTAGSSFNNQNEYDFWDHVDYVVRLAEKKGIYMALVPVWGGNVKSGHINVQKADQYAKFLANRYKGFSNIIWLNGGDIKGSDSLNIWKAIGSTLRKNDRNHLVTFHPRGRSTSSTWFHNESWLDFNMFQSGHKDYAQDTTEPRIGEDNWKFVLGDRALKPVKPTIDGEPSYEGIPHGLHEGNQPYWTDSDVRRYAYWSVFSGAAGFTYGHNAVMQFYTKEEKCASFFPLVDWKEGIAAPGAAQMKYLKLLMLSAPYFNRVYDESSVVDNGERYERVIGTVGKNDALFYTYTGRPFTIEIAKVKFYPSKAAWYNPRNGERIVLKEYRNTTTIIFDPPGDKREGNDWVLILEK